MEVNMMSRMEFATKLVRASCEKENRTRVVLCLSRTGEIPQGVLKALK